MGNLKTSEQWAVLQMPSGVLSFLGSSLLIWTILRSKKKLSLPYRRIIFGISIFDLCQSFSQATALTFVPRDLQWDPSNWAFGTIESCEFQGFVMTLGTAAIPMYLCSLCVYYFCIVALNMRKQVFQRIEPCLHAVPILYALVMASYALAKDYLNNYGSFCYIHASPWGCEMTSEVECTRGVGAAQFNLIVMYIQMANLVIIFGAMSVIVYQAKKIEKRNRRYLNVYSSNNKDRSSTHGPARRVSLYLKSTLTLKSLSTTNSSKNEVDTSTATARNSILQQRQRGMATERTRETTKQALLYVGSILLSYGFQWVNAIIIFIRGKEIKIIAQLGSFFFPLQGLFNIFVYCRPHIVALQKKYPGEYSWFRAFKVVLMSGGDSCHKTVNSERKQYQEIQIKKAATSAKRSADKSQNTAETERQPNAIDVEQQKTQDGRVAADVDQQQNQEKERLMIDDVVVDQGYSFVESVEESTPSTVEDSEEEPEEIDTYAEKPSLACEENNSSMTA